jgi:lysophospholipase L1-like esterase
MLLSSLAVAQGRLVRGEHWVGTWAAAPQMPSVEGHLAAADAGFDNQTVRMIVRVSVGGEELRVRFSNAFGQQAVTLADAHIALAGSGAAIVAGTDHALTFSGQTSFAIPPGAMALTDPVQLKVPALASLAISVFLPAATGAATWHQLARQTTYIAGPGDLSAAGDLPGAKTVPSWYWLSGIDVLAKDNTSAVVVLGDSITDGADATLDANLRWPDVVANEVSKTGDASSDAIAVLNEGISGNRLLYDGDGESALARLDRDVLAQEGVRYLVVLEGINDIGWPHMSAKYASEAVSVAEMIAALQQIAARAHERGIFVFGGTLTPFGGAFYQTPDGEAVNQWIRTSSAFDAVIDFDKITRDPANPDRFLPTYDSGDHLHPNDAGYQAMGGAVAQALAAAADQGRRHHR